MLPRPHWRIAIAALAAAGAATAEASESDKPGPHQVREQELAALFDCVAEREPDAAGSFVLAIRSLDEKAAKAMSVAFENCFDERTIRQIAGETYLYRGGLARALLLAGKVAPRSYQAPSVDLAKGDPKVVKAIEKEQRLSGFAHCVLEKAPDQANRFVQAVRYDPAEVSIWQEMKPLIEPCVTAVNDIGINSPWLRAILAIELWSRTASPRPDASGS